MKTTSMKVQDKKAWIGAIEAASLLIDEGAFRIDETGWKLRAFTPSQIAMIDMELPQVVFEGYDMKEPMNMALDFAKLSKITKRIKDEDKIELSIGDVFNIEIVGNTKRNFKMLVLSSNTLPVPKEPKIEFTTEIRINAGTLKDAMIDAKLIGDYVSIIMDEGLVVKAESDTGSVDIKFNDEDILSKGIKEKASAVFSLDYLDKILKPAGSGTVLNMKMRHEAPLRIEYAIGGGKVAYYLAPRIDST